MVVGNVSGAGSAVGLVAGTRVPKLFFKLATALLLASLMLWTPPPAYAHTTALIEINGKDYVWVIGSLNEPLFVDDKTGVQLFVSLSDPNDPLNRGAPNTIPVEGLQDSLQVEIKAGGESLILDLEPAFRSPGEYHAPFYATVATTLTYRFFGTIDETPVDIEFMSGGAHDAAGEEVVQLSEGVVSKAERGAFNTPQPRDELGFPEPYLSNRELRSSIDDVSQGLNSIDARLASLDETVANLDTGLDPMAIAGLGAGIGGLIIAILAIIIARKK